MGGMNIIVPPGVEVVVRGMGIMGGFDHRESGVAGDPGAPRVIVNGFAFWGGVGVERKLTREERRRLKEERRQEKLDRRSAHHPLAEGFGDHRRMLEEHREWRRDQRDERRERHRERRDRRRYGDR
jgi:hypothetical protein